MCADTFRSGARREEHLLNLIDANVTGEASRDMRTLLRAKIKPDMTPTKLIDERQPYALAPYTQIDVRLYPKLIAVLLVCAISLFCIPFGFYFAVFAPYLINFFVAPVAILGALTIWALPESRTAPTSLLAPLTFAFVTALLLWPNYLAISLPGLPWITMIRLTTFPLTLTFLVCVSVSESFRFQLKQVISETPLVWKALIVFVITQIFSIPFSSNTTQSVQSFIVAQTSWTIIFFASAYVFLKPGRAYRLALLIWVVAILVGLVGLAESRNRGVLWANHIPGFLKVGDEVVQRILAGGVRSATGQYRIQATFSTALGLSEYCALALPFILHFLVSSTKTIVRLAALASVPFMLVVIIGTDSRLGILGFFLSLMLYILLWGAHQWTRDRSSFIGPATVMAYPVIFVLATISTFVVGRIRNRVWGTGQYAASNEGRMAQLEAGLPKIPTHPLGHGVGMGGEALGYSNKAGIQTIDNYVLALALEVGIVGLIAYITMLFSAIYYAVKYSFKIKKGDEELSLLTPIAVSLVNFASIKIFFSNDDNHPFVFMLMGMATALIFRLRRSEKGVEQAASGNAA